MPPGPQTGLRPPKGKIHLRDVVKMLLRASRMGIRTAIPCTVETYDPALQKATVIAGNITVLNTDAGEREMEPMKVVSCPVRWPATGSGYLTFPLIPGDTGHLICSDRSLENWMNKAPVVPAVDPGARHTHNVIDGIFEPGLHPTTAPITPPTALDGTVLEGAPFIKLGALALPPFFAARVTDITSPGVTMATWVGAVSTFINGLAPGSVIPPTDFGVIASGSAKTLIE